METAVIAIVCIALIVVAGMTMSQGFLTSVDAGGVRFSESAYRDGEIMRTELTMLAASQPAAGYLDISLRNSGQVKQAEFDDWDMIVQYDDGSNNYVKWLPYNNGAPADDQWTIKGIYLNAANATPEVFEPGIFDAGEEMIIRTKLAPAPATWTTKSITVATASGVPVTADLAYLFAHSETTTISGTNYYRFKEGTTSDGSSILETTGDIHRRETGRWLLHNQTSASRLARHIYPLNGIDELLATTWKVYYRGQGVGSWYTAPSLSIDVIIRKSDGTIRQTIATNVAGAVIASPYNWQTLEADYAFPGYDVISDSDYLEIDYYGISSGSGPSSSSAEVQLRVDDSSLADTNQTRVENILYRHN
jgi:hypothetical protein